MNTTTTHPSTTTTGPVSLRTALLLDAAVTGANGLAYLAGAVVLDSLLGPTTGHLLLVGAFLSACAVILATIGSRRPIPRGWAMFAADFNIAWAVGSVALVTFGWLDLTTTGQVWTLLQAAVVATFAALQLLALRAEVRTAG
jgi:hypothetical protein